MKVLYLCADFGIPVSGHTAGAVHIRETVRALAASGIEVALVTPNVGDTFQLPGVKAIPVGLDEADKTAVERARSLCTHLEVEPRFYKDLRGIVYNSTAEAPLKEILRQEKPDVVYERYALWHIGCLEAARESNIPHVLEVNAPLCLETERRRGLSLPELAKAVERRLLRDTDVVACVSESLRAWLVEEGKVSKPIYVVPGAFNPDFFHPDVSGKPVRERLGLQGKLVVGFVGSMKPWHGLPELLQAGQLLRSRFPFLHLLLVGPKNGTEPEEEFAGFATWTGGIAHEEIPKYMAAMDICVLPNSNAYGSPVKLFEYMAMQKPVVAPRVGPVLEILSDGKNARLVAPGSVEELRAAIGELVEEKPLSRRLAEQARRDALAKHTFRQRAGALLRLAEEVIHKSSQEDGT